MEGEKKREEGGREEGREGGVRMEVERAGDGKRWRERGKNVECRRNISHGGITKQSLTLIV